MALKGDYVTVWVNGALKFWGTFDSQDGDYLYVTDYSDPNYPAGFTRKLSLKHVTLKKHSWQEMQNVVEMAHIQGTAAPAAPAEETPPPVQSEAKSPFVVAITGHRPDKLPDKHTGYQIPNPYYDYVVYLIADALQRNKPDYLITGMAIGVDQWAAEIALNLGIPFVAALPFHGQEQKWPPKSQAKFHLLLSQAYAKYVICEGAYEPWKMQKRNEWMVQSCHKLIAVWNGTPGGTANCVGYAQQVGKDIEYLKLPPPGIAVGGFFTQLQQKLEPKPQTQTATPEGKRIVEI